MGELFNTFVVQPIFNVLVFIYAIIPGHNFGIAIILFTIVVRIFMWPLLKKQLHQTRAMRKLQPELKKIKARVTKDVDKAFKTDASQFAGQSKKTVIRMREQQAMMELYKERGVSPFGSIGVLIVQFIVLIGLYQGLQRLVSDTSVLTSFSYDFIANLSWMQQVAANPALFDESLLGIVDLTRAAVGEMGFYFPAFLLVAGSAVIQFLQSRQIMPQKKDARKLRDILREASEGKQAEQQEVNEAIGQSTKYMIPVFIFVFTIGLASALSLYWVVGGIVAYIQQARILKDDSEEMIDIADSKTKVRIIEGEVVEKPTKTPKKKATNKKSKKASKSSKKRRK